MDGNRRSIGRSTRCSVCLWNFQRSNLGERPRIRNRRFCQDHHLIWHSKYHTEMLCWTVCGAERNTSARDTSKVLSDPILCSVASGMATSTLHLCTSDPGKTPCLPGCGMIGLMASVKQTQCCLACGMVRDTVP